MAYTPDWVSLAVALERVVVAGTNELQAKADLCSAMADRKIGVRVRIAAEDESSLGGSVFSDGNVKVPPHLRPGDLDWVQSRPMNAWPIGPMPGQHYVWISGWQNRPVDFLELSTADVLNVLCLSGGRSLRSKPSTKPSVRRGRTKGSGSWQEADEPLLLEMKELIQHKEAKSVEDAARLVAEKAKGSGASLSKQRRLARHYRDKYKELT